MANFFVHPSSVVENVSLADGASIYKECSVKNSYIGSNSSVGDYSRMSDVRLVDNVRLQRYQLMYNVNVGRYTSTGKNFTAWHCDIGAFCSISWNVSIGGANHDYHRMTSHPFSYLDDWGFKPAGEIGYEIFSQKCIVGSDVWVAAGAHILRDVTVGTGAVVATGAVVTKSVEPYTIVAGVPARPIKRRFDDELCQDLLESEWWNLPAEVIKDNYYLFLQQPTKKNLQQLLELKEKFIQEKN